MFGLLSSLVPLAILAGIAYAIVTLTRRRRTSHDDPLRAGDGFSARRLFVYVMTYAALLVAVNGLSGIFEYTFASAATRAQNELAGPLALTVVGVPVFALLAHSILRTHRRDPREREALGWSLYINAALLTTLAVTMGYAFATADAIIYGGFDGTDLAALVVWGAAWAAHWWAWREVRPGVLPSLQLWVASTAGLWIGAGAAGFLIEQGTRRLIEPSVSAPASAAEDAAMAVATLGVGAAVWSWHWLINGRSEERSVGWRAYVLIPGVLAGLVTAVVGVATIVYLTLVWVAGDPGTAGAAMHFGDAAVGVAALVAGGGVWWYHRALVGPSAERERTEVDRVYDYLVAAVGLVTVAVSVTILVLAFFEVIAPAAAVGADTGGANTLLAAVTALLVGGPMWALSWRRVQRLAGDDGGEEARSSSRRTYLTTVFGAGGAVAFGALIALLVVVFGHLFGERTGEAIARQIAVPVALLVTTAVVASYHWVVYRAERALYTPSITREVLLVAGAAIDPADISRRTHTEVRLLRRLDVDNGDGPAAEAVADAIAGSSDRRILVLADLDGVRVIPYST